MEELRSYLEDVVEKYGDFISEASRAASYAAKHPRFDYDGELDTVNLSLQESTAYESLEESLVDAQNLSAEMRNSINKLSKEMKIYRERKDNIPDEYYKLGDRLSRIREQFHKRDKEITDLMKQAERTERQELGKQRSIIGNKDAERLAKQIPFEPKR
jgi:hypothetical protein